MSDRDRRHLRAVGGELAAEEELLGLVLDGLGRDRAVPEVAEPIEPGGAKTYRVGAGAKTYGKAPALTVGEVRAFLLALELDDVPDATPVHAAVRGISRPRLVGLEVDGSPAPDSA